ncbi:TatD family hydrolase [Candidatus Wolfebacteria bacterium]|nr:TatD family hydrolase [Candidatus Wolfebacteria bacterium]
MMPRYFDAHSHLNFKQYGADRDDVIARMQDEGVWTITVGTDTVTSREAVALAEGHEHLFATVGVHPTDWESGFDADVFRIFAKNKKVVAVGECGLDYYRLKTGDQRQKTGQEELFESQIQLALEQDLPLMVHARPSAGTMDAYNDVVDTLTSYFNTHTSKLRGNVHFFVGDTDIAAKFLDMGFTLSFDGPITFTREYDEVVRYVPLDMLLAETDAPFAAPEPYRGKRNEPVYVKEIVRAIANIRKEDEEEVRRTLVENTLRVFHITL